MTSTTEPRPTDARLSDQSYTDLGRTPGDGDDPARIERDSIERDSIGLPDDSVSNTERCSSHAGRGFLPLVALILAPIVLASSALAVLATPASALLGASNVAAIPALVAQAPTEPAVVIGDELDLPLGESIPGPNSGVPPASASDRGGALQLALLALIIGFFALAAWRITAQVRAAKRSTPNDA